MLGSISPVGEASRNQRWAITVTAYTVASMVGGALMGAFLGVLGQGLLSLLQVPAAPRLAVLALVVVVAAAFDARAFGLRLPTYHRQVDENWLTTYRGWVYGAGFGFQLGTGIATIVPSAVTYAALAAAVLSGSWEAGIAIGTTFGAVRTLPLLATGRLRTADRLYAATGWVAEAAPRMTRVTIVGQAGLAAVAAAAAVAA